MFLKNIIPVFLCTALNLSATTQATQTDLLPEIYQLPTVQPICFSETTISKALQAAQIRKQALRASIFAEEAKGLDYLMKNRFYTLWNQRVVDLSEKQKQLGVDGERAVVLIVDTDIMRRITSFGDCFSIRSILDNRKVHTEYFYTCEPYINWYNYIVTYSIQQNNERSSLLLLGRGDALYLQIDNNGATPFLGHSNTLPNELCPEIELHVCPRESYALEPIEGEYHVDAEGRMMPMFNLVAEKKTEK